MKTTTITNLTEKYRPETLADIRGQAAAVSQLRSFLSELHESGALILEGGTGTGKTSAAIAFARELGVDVAGEEFGGLYQIPSGEQTADSVRKIADLLRLCPMTGNGWKVAIVNEADCTSPQAANVWLDVLENLPRRSVVIFTTNSVSKLSTRFRDRCELVPFVSSALDLTNEARAFVAEVWTNEGCSGAAPTLETLGAIVDGCISFRRILARLQPLVRAARVAAPVAAAPAPVAIVAEPAPAGELLERVYKGETIRVRVLADGFELNGETFGSLTAIAKRITGAASISGPAFFGCARRAA